MKPNMINQQEGKKLKKNYENLKGVNKVLLLLGNISLVGSGMWMADWVVGQVAHMGLHHQIDSHSQVRTLHEFLAARPMKAFQLSSHASRVTSKYGRCHQSLQKVRKKKCSIWGCRCQVLVFISIPFPEP